MENFKNDIEYFVPILRDLGFVIFEDQPHIKGERYAFRAKKTILLGERVSDKKKVVIKVTRNEAGKVEVQEERAAREAIKKIDFAYTPFLEPEEILFKETSEYLVQVTEYIEEEIGFLKRDLREQFEIAYRTFVMQEGIHAVTKKHNKIIQKYFKTFTFADYAKNIDLYIIIILSTNILNESEVEVLNLSKKFFLENRHRVEQYGGFLTHTDFVPHNFRVGCGQVYLLDHSAIIIGNKHEGWARFLNFCVLHNAELEKKFLKYFEINRSEEELDSLKLMRIYRLFELVAHHAEIYKNSQSELKDLSHKRIIFWLKLLNAILENKELDIQVIEDYKNNRDTLRSQEEKERQKVLY